MIWGCYKNRLFRIQQRSAKVFWYRFVGEKNADILSTYMLLSLISAIAYFENLTRLTLQQKINYLNGEKKSNKI